MRQQQNKFYQRAENERQALLLTDHITGRTEFDRAETAKINPRANYYLMNETMRQEFLYWRVENGTDGTPQHFPGTGRLSA